MFKCQLSTWGKDEKTRDVSVSWCPEDRMKHKTFDNSGKWGNVNVEALALQRRGNKKGKQERGETVTRNTGRKWSALFSVPKEG